MAELPGRWQSQKEDGLSGLRAGVQLPSGERIARSEKCPVPSQSAFSVTSETDRPGWQISWRERPRPAFRIQPCPAGPEENIGVGGGGGRHEGPNVPRSAPELFSRSEIEVRGRELRLTWERDITRKGDPSPGGASPPPTCARSRPQGESPRPDPASVTARAGKSRRGRRAPLCARQEAGWLAGKGAGSEGLSRGKPVCERGRGSTGFNPIPGASHRARGRLGVCKATSADCHY